MPAPSLEQVCSNLVADIAGKHQERVDEEDEIVAGVRLLLTEQGEHVNGNVAPEEAAPKIEHVNDTTNHGQYTVQVAPLIVFPWVD